MKKIFLITTLSVLIFSCGKKEETATIDNLIASKNATALQAKKALIND